MTFDNRDVKGRHENVSFFIWVEEGSLNEEPDICDKEALEKEIEHRKAEIDRAETSKATVIL